MRSTFFAFFLVFLAFGCSNEKQYAPQDTLTSGKIRISAEESFKPILEEEIKVFKSLNPQADFIVEYKPEIECLKDFMSDSTRMVFVTRGLDKREEAALKTQLSFTPTFGILAYSAIAILVNKQSNDTLYSLSDLRDRLLGKNAQTVAMDGNHLTGVVRFLKDSLVKDAPFGKNVVSADGSKGVIEYIKTHPNAIGFLDMHWIGDGLDPRQDSARKFVKTALLECTLCAEKGLYAQPSQSTIGKGQYSLSLPIYYILKENAPGLGSGLLNYMSSEGGQKIFNRAGLVPVKISLKQRKVI
jgi:phosphate transport system substrate-binding protein